WPKRSGFIQPLVDAELLHGLDRFDCVEVRWGTAMTDCDDTGDEVRVRLAGADGPHTVHARYVVGSDGGRSATRHTMGVSFEVTTSSTRWLVVDIDGGPLGLPNVGVGADPVRPNVSISLAHGIRRFEFLLHPHESDDE